MRRISKLRIGAGALKARPVGREPGPGTRPLLAGIRKSLFDILGPRLPGAAVLDVFAGTGSFGLEALSRGAASAVLVEMDHEAVRWLKESVATLGLGDRARIVPAEAGATLRALAAAGERFGVVMLDPPFAQDRAAELLAGAAGVLAPGGIVVLRLPVHRRLPAGADALALVRHNRYGVSGVGFYEREGEGGT